MNTLSPRQQSILNRVVDAYIETGQPVGSRHITELYNGLYRASYSSATVRNEMVYLEDSGYLTHPHTSAGRMPTDAGYRFYLDHGLTYETPSYENFRAIRQQLISEMTEADEFGEKTSLVLSRLSEQLGVFLYAEESTAGSSRYRLFVRGLEKILDKPEFDKHQVARLIAALEKKSPMIELMSSSADRTGARVSIGKEISEESLHDCAVISASVYCNGNKVGSIAVMGPKRMKYSRAVPLVSQVSDIVSSILDENEEMGHREFER